MSRLVASQRAWLAPAWVRENLSRKAQALPSLDLRFADTKSLADAVTGQSLITFTRASSGTYVGSDGLIKTATTNLLLRSEEIGTSPWGTNTPGAVTYTANAIAAPTGANTADRVTATADFAGPNQFTSVISGLSYSLSFYVKAVTPGSLDSIRIECFSGRFAAFNISTRVFSGVNAAITPSSVSLGDGWVRVQCLFTAPSTGSLAVAIYASTSSDFYLWGAQLEQSSTVGEYIPTTSTINSAPRFDHNPTTGESLGLLVEESRTNSIRNNTMVGAVAGTPGTAPTNWVIAQNGITGVSFSVIGTGVQNGISYIDIRVFGIPSATVTQAIQIAFESSTSASASASQTWTNSAWVQIVGGSSTNITEFTLNTQQYNAGVFVRENTVQFTPNTSTFSRYSGTVTFSAATTTAARPLLAFGTTASAAIDITLRIGLPQLEQGAFATSVIPTTTAAATRSADVASITGTNFSSWYRQDEGTVYFSAKTNFAVPSGPFPRVVQIQGATGSDKIEQSFYNGGQVCFVRNSAAIQAEWYPNYFIQNGVTSSFALATNNIAGSSNGVITGTDSVAVLPTVDRMIIGAETSFSNFLNGTIRRLTYWPTRLPNSTLQAITL